MERTKTRYRNQRVESASVSATDAAPIASAIAAADARSEAVTPPASAAAPQIVRYGPTHLIRIAPMHPLWKKPPPENPDPWHK
jgi:hypothetical protein